MVNVTIESRNGKRQEVEIPTEISLNLMEILKANDYDIPSTCGGLALCGGCHVEVLEGMEKLQPRCEQELETIDMLPHSDEATRLACQIKISAAINGLVVMID